MTDRSPNLEAQLAFLLDHVRDLEADWQFDERLDAVRRGVKLESRS